MHGSVSSYGGSNFRVDKPVGELTVDADGYQVKTTTFHMDDSDSRGDIKEGGAKEIKLSLRVKFPDLKSERGVIVC